MHRERTALPLTRRIKPTDRFLGACDMAFRVGGREMMCGVVVCVVACLLQ